MPDGQGATLAQGAALRDFPAAGVAAGGCCGGRGVSAMKAGQVAVGQAILSAAAGAGEVDWVGEVGGVHWRSWVSDRVNGVSYISRYSSSLMAAVSARRYS